MIDLALMLLAIPAWILFVYIVDVNEKTGELPTVKQTIEDYKVLETATAETIHAILSDNKANEDNKYELDFIDYEVYTNRNCS